GGDDAYENLRDRAGRRGIRLASDMVPNHTGIYSKWMVEHPGWFIQQSFPPYPGYQFNGPDLSYDGRVSLKIEDGYWSHSDAAVVFQRVDRDTGDTRYIYHGNDGTNMPWNDTAQLNYLLPEVREAVIQTILHVARMFPIIRFDAAMTLAKRHFQRLWFPKPGDGGAVPSRAEHGMTKDEFDRYMPKEFWREVVDRCAKEAPDTLLLAEAFWMMEGYFVRTLGMHRVYNSAFMNMLKMEQNADFRTTVKNVLEFTPEVLKRFVNFMNNPDELTAVEQFGKGDKYFGNAILMVTMPGLPMFGHGQVQGFTEKYGMEYRRAMWDERVDEDLVRRHEAEIFPLMRKRYLFSGIENFAFFDFEAAGGGVDENVFAYTNRSGGERALVLYNNAYSTTSGRVIRSVPMNVGESGKDKFLSVSLVEALNLRAEDNYYYILHDHKASLEYIRSGRQLAQDGLFVQLGGYQYHVFLGFTEQYDSDGSWGRLAEELGGGGSPDIAALHEEMTAFPVARSFRKFMTVDTVKALTAIVADETPVEENLTPTLDRFRGFLAELEQVLKRSFDFDAVVRGLVSDLATLRNFPALVKDANLGEPPTEYLLSHMPAADTEPIWFWRIPVTWAVLDSIHRVALKWDYDARSAFCIDDWDLLPAVRTSFNQLGYDWQAAHLGAQLVRILVNYRDILEPMTGNPRLSRIQRLMDDPGARDFLQVNRHEDILWFNQEQLEALVYWTLLVSVVLLLGDPTISEETRNAQVFVRYQRAQEILDAAEEAKYRVDTFLELLN
ncbi:MAG: alpha-amylase family glycosyl hydrolase, partial [FCB group bacterium]|nr:alpha-amylase family glycosyl hydrolase [FCB group bacterium]